MKRKQDLLEDCSIVAGLCLVARGLWLIYEPSMYLVLGAMLMWWGIPGRRSN